MTASTSFNFRVIGEVIRKDGTRIPVINDNIETLSPLSRLFLELLASLDIKEWIKLRNLEEQCLLHTHSLGELLKF